MLFRRQALKRMAVVASTLAGITFSSLAAAQAKSVKVGVLHSLSGTMAISETVLKDAALGIDFLERHQRHVFEYRFADRHGARQRVQHAYFY